MLEKYPSNDSLLGSQDHFHHRSVASPEDGNLSLSAIDTKGIPFEVTRVVMEMSTYRLEGLVPAPCGDGGPCLEIASDPTRDFHCLSCLQRGFAYKHVGMDMVGVGSVSLPLHTILHRTTKGVCCVLIADRPCDQFCQARSSQYDLAQT